MTDTTETYAPPAIHAQPQGTVARIANDYLHGQGVDVLAGLVPPGVEQAAVVNAFLATVAASNDLMSCAYPTLEEALRSCARMGLLPGPAGHVYVIPRGGKATVQVGYQGLLAMLKRAHGVLRVETDSICANDRLVARRGDKAAFSHEPAYSDRGEPYAYYAVAYFEDGSNQWEIMTIREIEEIRDKYGNKSLWAKAFGEKARITVFRRLAKWIGQDDALSHAFRLLDHQSQQSGPVQGRVQSAVMERLGRNG